MGGAAIGKQAPAIIPLAGLGISINAEFIVQVVVVIVGVALGAMWRAGSLREEGKDWNSIRNDLIISCLIGGANVVIALALIDWAGLRLLPSMALSAFIGATGLRALPEIKEVALNIVKKNLGG